MENKQALKLIEKIQKELFKDNFEVLEIVTDLKKLREITLDLNNPFVTKALRLAYQHLENNNGFLKNANNQLIENERNKKENLKEWKKDLKDVYSLQEFEEFIYKIVISFE